MMCCSSGEYIQHSIQLWILNRYLLAESSYLEKNESFVWLDFYYLIIEKHVS